MILPVLERAANKAEAQAVDLFAREWQNDARSVYADAAALRELHGALTAWRDTQGIVREDANHCPECRLAALIGPKEGA